jgi:CO/xanthine dehydrogenase FAD-binding subunit
MGDYLRPTRLHDALTELERGEFLIIAGGTDIFPACVGRPIDKDVLDISGISAIRGIVEEDECWNFGAASTWSDVISADLPDYFHYLQLAAREVGGKQIQNVGTVGGNVCNASPAADGVPALIALGARVRISSVGKNRGMPVEEFIKGNRATILAMNEVLSGFEIPKPMHSARSNFYKIGARAYLVISISMVAVVVEVDENETIKSARIVVGSCSAVAQRIAGLEELLVGLSISADMSDVVQTSHFQVLTPIDDVRGTADYRIETAVTAVRRSLAGLSEVH